MFDVCINNDSKRLSRAIEAKEIAKGRAILLNVQHRSVSSRRPR